MAVLKRQRDVEAVTAVKRSRHTAASVHLMQTRLAKTSAPKIAVLQTTELLENILGNLNLAELLIAQRVCEKWSKVIATSPELQRAMFVRAGKVSRIWILDGWTQSLRPYVKGEEEIRGQAWTHRQGQCKPAIVNPLLLTRDPECVNGNVSIRDRFELAETLRFVSRPQLSLHPGSKSMLSDMFLTNPPTKDVQIELAYSPSNAFHPIYSASPGRLDIRRDKGVKWSDVEEKLRSWLSDKGRQAIEERKLRIYLARTRIWAIGVVFPSLNEAEAIDSGKEVRPGDDAIDC